MSDDIQQQAAPEQPEVMQPEAVDTTAEGALPEGEQEQQQAAADDAAKPDRDEKGRFKPGVQQRIDEITRARHEAEREAAYWRQRAMAGTESKAQPSANEPPPKPTPDKYQDYAEYVEALTDWKTDQKVREALSARDSEQAKQAEGRVQQTKQQAFAERVQQARTSITDYDEVVGLSDLPIAQHVGEVLLDSDVGPQLAYHLAKNPDLANRLNQMSPTAAAREIGRIEASIEKPVEPVAKSTSKAPPPINPIGSGRTNATANPAQMDMEQYKAHRAKQGARWSR